MYVSPLNVLRKAAGILQWMILAAVRSAEEWTWVSRTIGVVLLLALIAGVVALFFVTSRR